MTYFDSHRTSDCFGCGVCVAACPKQCISMSEDIEGFRVPVVDKNKCINCNLCKKVCPQSFDDFLDTKRAYVGYHSEDIVFKSSSGGAFTTICESVVAQGYVVYGAVFDKNLKVIHKRAETIEDCKSFRKSKYIQSNIDDCYIEIASLLKNNRKVLFSGTPCQCAALHNYLLMKEIERINLLTVSVLCRGVPSQKLFDAYIKEVTEKYGKVISYTFKSKHPIDGQVNSRSACIELEDHSSIFVDRNSDPYLSGYYSRLFLRPSCGVCRFAVPERVSDITLADAWGIECLYPELNPLNGVSLILVHSQKGEALLRRLQPEFTLKEVDVNWAMNSQTILHRPVWINDNRAKFFKLWNAGSGFFFSVKKALHISFLTKCKCKLRAIVRNINN